LTGTCSPTARLRFRRPALVDAPEIFRRYSTDPEVTRFLGWPRHRSVADAEGFIAFSDHEWTTKPAGPLLIERLDTGQLIGSTGLMWDGPASAQVGYVLAQDAWGQGFATEALGAMVAFAAERGVTRLAAQCHPAHGASAHVLEKWGFRLNARFVAATFPNLAAREQDSLLFVRPPTVDLERVADRSDDDVAQCAAMMATSEPWLTLDRTVDALIPVIDDRDKELHVVRDAHGIAGFAVLDLRGLLNGYVQTLCVRPDRRGSGLGAALLTAAELRVLDQSANVFLCVSSFNTRAQKFYARLGYETIGVMRDLVIAGADEILLRKTVRSFR
jgi:RimJ/RimL family protein N-acetyltransferase